MRASSLFSALLCLCAVPAQGPAEALHGTLDDKIQWLSAQLEASAKTHYFDPLSRKSDTSWKLTGSDGCRVELTQTIRRTDPEAAVTPDEIQGIAEDRIVHWNFNLGDLKAAYVSADSSTGAPNVRFFALGNIFQLSTSVTLSKTRPDSIVSSSNWTHPGSASNLWIYFNAPETNNTIVVKQVASVFRDAIDLCAPEGTRKPITRDENIRRSLKVLLRP